MVQKIQRLSDKSDKSDKSRGSQAEVDPELIQAAIQVLSKLCATSTAQAAVEEKDEDEPPRSKSEQPPNRKLFDTPPSCLQRKRYSRGPGNNTPRVRFAVPDSDEDDSKDTGAAKANEIDTKVRGRRISRGPDGRSYQVADPSEVPPDKQ